jgi:luciferase-like monooxygenase
LHRKSWRRQVRLMRGDVGGRLRLSILDHTPVSSGSTLGEAFWHSTRLAELAEQVGYERYWVAEHHNMPWLASSSPAVLVAHVAARTTRLRVGSGGIMLPNYAPLAVVEQFGMLEELHPGRIAWAWAGRPGETRSRLTHSGALIRTMRHCSPRFWRFSGASFRKVIRTAAQFGNYFRVAQRGVIHSEWQNRGHVVNLFVREVFCALNVIDVIGVPAVDEDVACF